MITPREYIRRVDKQAKADGEWLWSKKWIRLPTSVFLVLITPPMFAVAILQAIKMADTLTLSQWIFFSLILLLSIYYFCEGVKGLSNKGGKQ